MTRMNGRVRGFSLIELVIVIAIVAILAAVALPTYQDSVRKGYRSQAQSDLLAAAQAMERRFSTTLTYVIDPAPFPPQSPTEGDARYNLRLVSDASTFTITATPVAGSTMAGDGNLAINHLGQRFWDRGGDGAFGAGDDTWEN